MNFSDFTDLDLNGKTGYITDRVKGISVTIPDHTAAKATRHAKIRKYNHRNHKICNFNDNADEIGLYGECIFGIYYNLEVDWEIKKNDDFDFQVGNFFIDTKSTEYSSYMNIKSNRFHDKPNWLYVFCPCRIKFNDGKIVGWLSGTDVKALGKEITNVKTPYWRVSFASLYNMSTIRF